MKKIFQLMMLALFILSSSACSGFGKKLKSMLNGTDSEAMAQPKGPLKFSDQGNVSPGPERQYKKMTRSSFEDQSRIDARSGSLWVMEGQGAYLFSENVIRLVGDPINVALDGEPKQQLETKVKVIRGLLARLESPRRGLASQNAAKAGAKAAAAKDGKPAAAKAEGADGADAAGVGAEESDMSDVKDANFDVKNIPTRIVERLVDGNYRVKGSQGFMIGKREYRVIATGVVRADEFTESGVPASKLLEPRFDIVSAPKGTQKL